MPSFSTLLSILRSGQFWYLFPHHFYRWKRSRDAERTAPVSTVPLGQSSEIPELHLLTGTESTGDLIYAAKSLVRAYESPISLLIHGDGTLLSADRRRLETHFPEGRVVTKDERDEKVLPVLDERGLENCREFRTANVFAERLVDTAVLSQSKMIINMDTDCLAFGPLEQLRSFVEEGIVTHIQDPQEQPFSVTDEEAYTRFGVEPVRHFNAGLCAFPLDRIDLDQIEEWLSPPGYPIHGHCAEQTILAALAALGPSQPLSPEAYTFDWERKGAAFIHYAAHYLSETRIAMRRDGQERILQKLSS